MRTQVVKEPGSVVATARTRCPACRAWNSVDIDERLDGILCGRCEKPIHLHITRPLLEGDPLEACPRCRAKETSDFWVRKDFDPKVGVGIVAVAAILAFWTYGLSLLVATIVDGALYFMLPSLTTCYHCRTEIRGLPIHPKHGGFDLAHQEDLDAANVAAAEDDEAV